MISENLIARSVKSQSQKNLACDESSPNKFSVEFPRIMQYFHKPTGYADKDLLMNTAEFQSSKDDSLVDKETTASESVEQKIVNASKKM